MANSTQTETTQQEIICKGCGSKMTYAPGTNVLKCEHCGMENEISGEHQPIEEQDFEKFISEFKDTAEKQEVATVKCDSCGAQTTFEANIVSGNCPFCGTPLVITSGSLHQSIQPKSLLPFLIDRKKATELYNNWLKNLWWAPGDLARMATEDGQLSGMYIPYWTYDANTTTSYIGERGDDIYEEEEYEETDDNGNSVIRTRTVVRTIWFPVSGVVSDVFENTLVAASRSLPAHNMMKLEPWDLQDLVPFNPSYLSGYKTESYQIDLKEGFEDAKTRMEGTIYQSVLMNIGGNHQQVISKETRYDNITFKHILLPVWISSYRYNGKAYRFLVNGRTGHIQGDRPYSIIKISLAILGLIALLILLFLIF